MGFLSLIPATDLGALYNPSKGLLTISAKGDAQQYTASIHFSRLPFMGGLKFELQGWVGPLTQKKQPYEASDNFTIQLPSPALPSGTVVIVTSNWPNGKVVPIYWVGVDGKKELLVPGADKSGSGSSQQSPPSPTTNNNSLTAISNHHNPFGGSSHGPVILPPTKKRTHAINVLLGFTFTLAAASSVPKLGRVDLVFDDKFLKLVNASIEDTSIVWELEALQTGNTSLQVRVLGGVAGFTQVTEYVVVSQLPMKPSFPFGPGPVIISGGIPVDPSGSGSGAGPFEPPFEPGPVVISGGVPVNPSGNTTTATNLDPTTTTDPTKVGITEILSFVGRVFIAWRIVTASYPAATMLFVTATLPKGVTKPTTNPNELSQLKATFNIPASKESDRQRTLFITSTGWGTWGAPVVKDGPWVGVQSFEFPPVEGMLDIVQAAEIVKEEGHTGPFWSVSLVCPLGEGGEGEGEGEVFYRFDMEDGEAVFVAVGGGEGSGVRVNKAGQGLLPGTS